MSKINLVTYSLVLGFILTLACFSISSIHSYKVNICDDSHPLLGHVISSKDVRYRVYGFPLSYHDGAPENPASSNCPEPLVGHKYRTLSANKLHFVEDLLFWSGISFLVLTFYSQSNRKKR